MAVKCYDRDGNPIGLWHMARLLSDEDYVRVAYTRVGDGIEVSTVWLGINHQWLPDAPPLIFETMVFCELDDLTSEGTETVRYVTLDEAIRGHEAIVAELQGNFDVAVTDRG